MSQGNRIFTKFCNRYTILSIFRFVVTSTISYSGSSSIYLSSITSCIFNSCTFSINLSFVTRCIFQCIASCIRCISITCSIVLNYAISFNNSCFATCSFKGCRIHLNKIFIQRVRYCFTILINYKIITSLKFYFFSTRYLCRSSTSRYTTRTCHSSSINFPTSVNCIRYLL